MKNIVIVDNNPNSFCLDNNNGIPIKSFYEDKKDQQLLYLASLLEKLSKVHDVRCVIRDIINTKQIDIKKEWNVIEDLMKHKTKSEKKVRKYHNLNIQLNTPNKLKILNIEKVDTKSSNMLIKKTNEEIVTNMKDDNLQTQTQLNTKDITKETFESNFNTFEMKAKNIVMNNIKKAAKTRRFFKSFLSSANNTKQNIIQSPLMITNNINNSNNNPNTHFNKNNTQGNVVYNINVINATHANNPSAYAILSKYISHGTTNKEKNIISPTTKGPSVPATTTSVPLVIKISSNSNTALTYSSRSSTDKKPKNPTTKDKVKSISTSPTISNLIKEVNNDQSNNKPFSVTPINKNTTINTNTTDIKSIKAQSSINDITLLKEQKFKLIHLNKLSNTINFTKKKKNNVIEIKLNGGSETLIENALFKESRAKHKMTRVRSQTVISTPCSFRSNNFNMPLKIISQAQDIINDTLTINHNKNQSSIQLTNEVKNNNDKCLNHSKTAKELLPLQYKASNVVISSLSLLVNS